MLYFWLLRTHIALATTSLLLFQYRFWRKTVWPKKKTRRPMRWIPHALDSALFATGLALCFAAGFIPFYTAMWLGFKLLSLACYIGFGLMAMRSEPRSAPAFGGYCFATLCAAQIVYLAIFKPAIV